MHSLFLLPLKKIEPEKNVQLSGPRKGSFDFLAQTKDGKQIGIEILTRASKGKMKKKLDYAKRVDEYVFVIPDHILDGYKKHEKKGLKSMIREKFFPKEFDAKNIFVWVFDLEKCVFSQKKPFSKIFNTKT